MTTRAEDRATVGTDLSTDLGAKTEGRAEDHLACSARSSHPLRDWHPSDKSLAATAASPRTSRWPEYPEKCGQIFRNAQTKPQGLRGLLRSQCQRGNVGNTGRCFLRRHFVPPSRRASASTTAAKS